MSLHPSSPNHISRPDESSGRLSQQRFVQIPGFEIECEIGRGGMATVYRAVQQSLSRQVALKVLARDVEDDVDFKQRFKKEGRILAQLLHPNIVTIHDIGVSEDGHFFLSIEYLSGGTLKDKMRQGLSFEAAIQIVISIAKALKYAHERGIIHRDVKPSNIMFRHDDTSVLTDFGVARVVGSKTLHTNTGLMIGSPGYMSPEQAMGESATIQSDLYALGVVFYEMLVGRSLYGVDSNPIAITLKHLYDPIPDLPSEHAYLQPVLNKLLAKKSSNRYKNADEFLKSLDKHRQTIKAIEAPIQQPSYIKNYNRSATEFATGKIRILLKNRLRFLIIIVGVIIFIAILYAFQFNNSVHQVEISEPAQPARQTEQIQREQEITTLLKLAEAQLKAKLLAGESEEDNAEATYQRILSLDPGNARALVGLENIAKEYEKRARQQFDAGALQESLKQITHGLAAAPNHEELLRLRQEVERQISEADAQKSREEEQRQSRLQAEQFFIQAQSNFREGALELSLAQIEQGLLAVPGHSGLVALREQVKMRMAEQQRQEEARRQAEEAERRKTEQARQQAEARRREADQHLARAMGYQREGKYADGLQQIEKGLVLVPDHEALVGLREEVRGQLAAEQQRQAEQAKREQEIKTLLKQADTQWKAKRLTDPAGDNAEATYRQVLQLDPNNAPARDGVGHIAQEYEQRAQQRRSAGALQDSLEQIDKGLAVVPDHEGLMRLHREVEREIAEAKVRQAREEEQRLKAERFLAQAQSGFQQGALEASLTQIEQGLGVVPGHQGLLALREQVKAQMAEQARQQAEAMRRQAEEARRQAEIAERQKAEQAEQARQQAEVARRRQEAEQYLARALDYQRGGRYADSLQQIEAGLALVPDHAELTRLRKDARVQLAAEQKRQAEQAKREREIRTLLEQAEAHLKAKRLTQPAGNNAEENYRQVLKLDAGNAQAQAGFGRIAQEYEQLARQRREAGALQESLTQIDRGLAVAPDHEGLLRLRQEVSVEWEAEQQRLEQQRKEQERQRLEQQRKEQERLKQQRQEQQRLEQQQQDKQRKEQQRLEQQQLEKQRQEQQRLEQQRLEQQRNKQRLEQQQMEKQRQEQQRLEQQQNKQRLEQQQLEKQRQEQQRLEQQRQEKQQQEQQRQDTNDAPDTKEKPQRRIFGTF